MKLLVGRTYFCTIPHRDGGLSDITALKFKGVKTLPDGRTVLAFGQYDDDAHWVERWINPAEAEGWVLTRDELIAALMAIDETSDPTLLAIETSDVVASDGDPHHAFGIRVARAIDNVYRDPGRRLSATTCARLDNIIATLGPDAPNDAAREALEQCIAERKFAEAAISNDDIPLAEQTWEKLEAIGYTSALREADMLHFRCQWLLASGRLDEARDIIARHERLVHTGVPANSYVRMRYERSIQRLRSALLDATSPR